VSRLVLDAGALIALDRGHRLTWGRFALARANETRLVTHGGVIAQVWRGARQARLAQASNAIDIVPIDRDLGRLAGLLLAASRTADIVDAALVALSRDGDRILTSDPDDLLRLATAASRDVEIVPV
jgi:hypothetical protein